MSDYRKCPQCSFYSFTDKHTCPPVWRVWDPKDGQWEEDAEKVYESSAQEATERIMAENHSDWDYPEEIELHVTDHLGEHKKVFIVRAELVPEFNATEKKE